MKGLWIYMICGVLFPLGLGAQTLAEYNRKGDEAMKRQDYMDAKMWYEEGVAQCDTYSIDQLTQIWMNNERLRPSMRSLMNKCLNCLNVKAMEYDPKAMSQLIVYYTEGIGTPKNKELAAYWKERQESRQRQLKPAVVRVDSTMLPAKRQRMKFFVGYSYSVEAPYGITVGGVGQRMGWYVRLKTNMSFQNYTDRCNDRGEIIEFSNSDNESYEPSAGKSTKTNSLAATVGMVVKCTPWLYASAGLGYGDRTLLHGFTTHAYEDYDRTREVWCRNIDSSYRGVAAEVDLMVRFAKSLYISAGCNTVNFKYVDLNAGFGVFF